MNKLNFDCIGIICCHLPIEDLNSLQKSCVLFWNALKSKKLGYVWVGKYQNYYQRNWDNIRSKRKRYNQRSNDLKDIIIGFNSNIITINCDCEVRTIRMKNDMILRLKYELSGVQKELEKYTDTWWKRFFPDTENIEFIRTKLKILQLTETITKLSHLDFIYSDRTCVTSNCLKY